ncbi:MAG TPA: GDP-mannose 4,6-dehydratase [Armatimonadota bacterium]|nr:GDP-mannose 4,6-dehydratase [Armatimonadota bacterium]
MTTLVTGAGGFIGSHVTEALLRAGHNVRALVHYNSRGSRGHLEYLEADLLSQVDIRLGDITDSAFVRELVAGCDTVLHLAALIAIPYSYQAPASYVAANIGGTLNVLEACRASHVTRLVITSTSEVYGTARYTPIDEDHPLQGQSPYAASKIGADKLAESFWRSFDLPVVTLRPFNTYGPRQSARAIIPTVLTQALAGAPEIRLGNLDPKRDLTFVEDTARAFLLAAETPGIEGEVIHFGQGYAVSVGEIAQRCLEVVGSHASVVSVAERQRPDRSEVGLLLCGAERARRRLGWTPQVTLEEGLRRTANYLRQNLGQYQTNQYVV